ncbi:MAG: type IX secretion system protein PorQ [Bacteroidales bacterium]|nr:type IX secretion system protein PorQ [Bacteroidales bacterium]
MKEKILIYISLFFLSVNTYSQIGNKGTYKFLNLATSPRILGLGSDFIPVSDDDIMLALSNPSIISKGMDNKLGFCFIDYFSDINSGLISYSKTFNKYGSFAGNIQFIDYGSFDRTDNAGNILGTFSSKEYAVTLGWGRKLDSSFSIGANLKSIMSYLEDYKSYGITVDIAGTYFNKNNNFTAVLIAKNIGRQVKYYSEANEALPFEIQAGLSKRFQHVPLRLNILYNHIEKFNLTYDDPDDPDPNTDPLTNEITYKNNVAKNADKFLRHFVVGIEFIPLKFFNFQLSYNYQRRKEMRVPSKISTVGLAWGCGIKISKFNLNYARSTYHLAGSPNYLSLSTNISDLIGKK